jgi:DHA2 family methylenomycin A resistance protein-like MFS transporter
MPNAMSAITVSVSRRGDAAVLLGICLGFFVILLDATAVNVALGAIAASLGGSIAALQWVVNAYTVVFAGLMLVAGTVADRRGALRAFRAGLAAFAIASAACALAPSIGVLVAARAVQGVGAAAILPSSLALIARRFPAAPGRARALGVWGGVSGVGLAAGPVVGGVLTSTYGWRAVFLVVVPAAAIAAMLLAGERDERSARRPARIDAPGHALAALTLTLVTAALTQTSVDGWTGRSTIALGAGGVLSAVALVQRERRGRARLVPANLLAKPRFRAAVVIGALFNFALYGTLFCLALHLARADGLSARTTGAVLAPLTVAVATAALLSGRLTARVGPRGAMTAGLTGGALGAALLATLGPTAAPALTAMLGAVLGSAGLAMPAMTGVVLAAAPPGHASFGAATLNASRQTGGALGVALLGSLAGRAGAGLTLPMAAVAAAYLAALGMTARSIRG